jgi:hypothetical protein
MSTRVTRVRSRATGNDPSRGAVGDPTVAVQSQSGLDILANAAATVLAPPGGESSSGTRTRSGRISKPPERYEPVEQVEDDYAPDDYDTDESDISSTVSSEDEDEEDDSDADEDGNLDGFVVSDKSETSDSESDGEPPVSVQKRRAVAVKKRPATTAAASRK